MPKALYSYFLSKGISRWIYSFLCILLSHFTIAQQQVKIDYADKLLFDRTQTNAQRLIGNVKFSHQNATMFCDSAYFFSDSNSVKAFGNIRIIEDTLQLFGDSLYYYGNSKKAIVIGNVVMKTNKTQLKTNRLIYDRRKSIAYYPGKGILENFAQHLHLESELGSYSIKSGLFSFKNNVWLKHPDFQLKADTFQYYYAIKKARFIGPTDILIKDSTKIYTENGNYNLETTYGEYFYPTKMFFKTKTLTADTIFIHQKENWAICKQHLVVTDTSKNLVLGGNYGYINQLTDSIFIANLPYLQQYKDSDTLSFIADTIIVKQHSDTLKQNDSTIINKQRHFYAFHHVAFFKSDMQGKCDSMVYHSTDSLLHLYNNPIVWSGKNQMTADSVYLRFYDGKIQRLYLKNNAFICSENDSLLKFYDQISGKDMTGFFNTDNKLKKVIVLKNAQTLYYAIDDNGKYLGVNKAVAANLEIRLKNEKIHRIVYLSKPSAKFIPINELTEKDKFFKGFKWLINEKPNPVLLKMRISK